MLYPKVLLHLSSSCILNTVLVPRKIFTGTSLNIEYMYALRATQSSIVSPVICQRWKTAYAMRACVVMFPWLSVINRTYFNPLDVPV